jgi:hypothetical protein
VDFIARLAALVPKPRVNLTRYHGVLAPNHRWRGLVTQAKRGKGAMRPSNKEAAYPTERHAAMTWAQRLKRVFKIEFEVCNRCGGSVSVIACIEDQNTIDRILAHIHDKEHTSRAPPLLTPPSRAPPETLPLFAAKESALSQIHQQERRRVVTAENLSARSATGYGLRAAGCGLQAAGCRLQFKNERI